MSVYLICTYKILLYILYRELEGFNIFYSLFLEKEYVYISQMYLHIGILYMNMENIFAGIFRKCIQKLYKKYYICKMYLMVPMSTIFHVI